MLNKSMMTLCVSLLGWGQVYASNDYIYTNGMKIEMGLSVQEVKSKLGAPQTETAELLVWKLTNGNRLAVGFNQNKVNSATISGSKPDYLYSHGIKMVLGEDSLQTAHQKHTSGCYHQAWGGDWIGEYVVRSGPKDAWYLNFSTWSKNNQNLKNDKLTALSLEYAGPLGQEKYCQS